MLIIGNFVSFFITILLNRLGYHVFARVLLSWMVSVYTFAVSLLSKMDAIQINDDQFYAPRFYILMTAVIPVLIFTTKRKWALGVGLAGSFITLLFFDPIHNSLGIGYYQSGYSSPGYPFITIITMVIYLIVVISLIIYKRSLEKYEGEQVIFTSSLKEKNEIIEAQKSRLELSNDELNEELRNKNKELVKSISELRQFSYTLSHNLRSPVASILGLSNILQLQNSKVDEETKIILDHIRKSSQNLDETISDLGNLLEIKDNIGQVKEAFHVKEEIDKVLTILSDEITASKVKINIDSNASSQIVSVRAYIHSILYNLISNALKFGSPDSQHVIHITTNLDESNLIISVKDNGIGIDLEQYGGQLFKMYKRLNVHASGKGLGLYITYYQVEALNGTIDVTSDIGKGTTFTVNIPI
jgi:signal transduction histidine kinase